MKIIVNGKFLSQRITGVQRFAREILKELDKSAGDLDIEIAVPRDAFDVPEYMNIPVKPVGRRKGTLWEQTDFMRYVKKKKAISLNLCNSAPLFGKKIATIHDVKIKVHPEYFNKKFLLWYTLLFRNITKKSLKLITVSEFSQNEILKYYKTPKEKICIIPNGWQHYNAIAYDGDALKKYNLQAQSYYFAMSSLEPNKNLNWIINVASNNPSEKFVVAGGMNKNVFAQKNNVVPANIDFAGYVSDEEAKSLLKNCKAFLYPTFYEGFGIPPLEAICAGVKKLIVSDTEIMHEVLGDKINFINPDNSDVDLSVFTRELTIDESNQILKKYSWSESAEKLYTLLKAL